MWWGGIVTCSSPCLCLHLFIRVCTDHCSGSRRGCEFRSICLRSRNLSDSSRRSKCSNRVSYLGIGFYCIFVPSTNIQARAVLGAYFLNERLGVLGKLGCALSLLGSVIIVLHAPPDQEIGTIDEILHYALQPGIFQLLTCAARFAQC